MNRRNFLQVLAAIPAIAALPVTAKLLAKLPLIEGEYFGRSSIEELQSSGLWLWINKIPVDCIELSVRNKPDFIEVSAPIGSKAPMREFVRGLDNTELEALIYAGADAEVYSSLHKSFYDEVLIEANFGRDRGLDVWFVATGLFTSLSVLHSPYEPVTARISMTLFGATYNQRQA